MYQDPSLRALSNRIVPQSKRDFAVGEQFRTTAEPDGEDFTVASVIDWYGPYKNPEQAWSACKRHGIDAGFYLVAGRRKIRTEIKRKRHLRHWGKTLQYIGISKDVSRRVTDRRHVPSKLSKVGREIWIGKFTQPVMSVSDRETHAADMRQTECTLIQALKPVINRQCAHQAPKHRVIIRNHFYNDDGEKAKARADWQADIVDYPEPQSQINEGHVLKIYSLDNQGRVQKKQTVFAGSDTMSGMKRIDRAVDGANVAGTFILVAGAIFLLVADNFLEPHAAGGQPSQVPSQPSPLQAVVDNLKSQLQSLQQNFDRVSDELAQARSDLQQAVTENMGLRQENSDLKDRIAALQAAPAKGGLDSPPCWRRPDGQPDYLFNATISSAGIRLEKAYRDKTDADYAALPVSQVRLNQNLSVDEFLREVRPIYDYGVQNHCRHFVRLYEGENDSVEQYKTERQAVENNFYIFRPQ